MFIFIKQVLNPDKSCKKAIADFLSEEISAGKEREISTNTGPYCKARQRLPEEAIQTLVNRTGDLSTKQALSGWKVYGREIKAIDGTTVKMSDSEANQHVYPQHKNQEKGAGFPIARLLVIISLTTGTVIDYASDAHKGKGTGEQALLRRVWGCIEKDDIVLGDRYYPSFFVMANIQAVGADGLFRGQSQRHYDFRRGEKLGTNDHIISWKKPNKPDWMSQEDYKLYPSSISIREFKVSGIIYVTTFLNSKAQEKEELAAIYKMRWQIELGIDNIKTTMNMDMLSCKTPEMVRKEIGVHLLAYNMIRILMAEACQKHGSLPFNVSFKGTIQLLNSFMPYFVNSTVKRNRLLYNKLLQLIVKNKIGNRPGRVEPRLIKQRQKPFKTLKKPRSIEKGKLLNRIEKMRKKYATA